MAILDKAKFLCSLPKSLGLNPENQKEIFLNSGRFGPYLQLGKKMKSLPPGVTEHNITNQIASQIIEMPRRAKWASKELAEFLEYCYKDQIDTQEIGGSYAGAFGFGQFIPSSFNNYSVDFNEDGIREPYAWPDVLASIANYLRKNGYKANSKNYKAIICITIVYVLK